MERKRSFQNGCFVMIIIGFLVSSTMVFLIPFASFKGSGVSFVLAYVIGGGFWLGLLISLIFMTILDSHRRNRINKKKAGNKNRKNKAVAIIKFFSNKPATFFDWIFIISIISEITILVLKSTNQLLTITVLFLLVFSFEMHCVFNGKNYLYISLSKREELVGGGTK
ncbi:hypothetical protein [Clostridium lacusfryxellense]|uniref:hypothetical protein n=1 Tax=Clostridium lacusfryxellense TaxID=205328 RepID=UPI001C0D592B|nr:hypothetical protein [Clostridium lacusfryxellense]MBU3112354.1 hypothetical protein [Clostridium lacusfryxellense]